MTLNHVLYMSYLVVSARFRMFAELDLESSVRHFVIPVVEIQELRHPNSAKHTETKSPSLVAQIPNERDTSPAVNHLELTNHFTI